MDQERIFVDIWLQELSMISNNDSPFAIFINELDKFHIQPFHNIEPQII